MNWIAFQLVFDIIIFAFIIAVVVLMARQRQSTPEEVRALAAALNVEKEKAEAVMRELERLATTRRNMLGAAAPDLEPAEFDPPSPAAARGFNPAAGESTMDDNRRKVAALHKHGMAATEISRRLAIPLPEVELIVAMLEGGE